MQHTAELLSVAEAEQIILAQRRDYGLEWRPFMSATGLTLAEDLKADRDLPPYDRVTMDGIAVRFADIAEGIREFTIVRTMAAGDDPASAPLTPGTCIEIMTGAAMPSVADAVIPYEHFSRKADHIALHPETSVKAGQNIHRQGQDRTRGDSVVPAGTRVSPALLQIAAAVGQTQLAVKKLPRVLVLSSGDELVDAHETPQAWQIRRSNTYALQAALLQDYGIAADMLHLPDDPDVTRREIGERLSSYDVLLLSGGVSMGKFDYIPAALIDLGVQQLFHKVRQKPGKPFWFGVHPGGAVIFALPGNPVSTFLCWRRYVRPWLDQTTGLSPEAPEYAALDRTVQFAPPLQYFMQVSVSVRPDGLLSAAPKEGHGSGDFANLIDNNAFMELPAETSVFPEGSVYRVWRW